MCTITGVARVAFPPFFLRDFLSFSHGFACPNPWLSRRRDVSRSVVSHIWTGCLKIPTFLPFVFKKSPLFETPESQFWGCLRRFFDQIQWIWGCLRRFSTQIQQISVCLVAAGCFLRETLPSNSLVCVCVLMYNIMIHDLKSQLQSTWFFVKISTNYCVLIRKTWNLKSSTNGVICYSPKLTLIADTIVKKSWDFKTCAGTFSKTHPALRENI